MKKEEHIESNNFINIRYLFFISISLILGTVFSYNFFASILSTGKIKWIVYFSLVLFIFVLFTILSFIKINNKFFATLKRLRVSILVSLIAFVFATLFTMSYCLYYDNLNERYSDVTISAKIENVTQNDNYIKIDLRKIKVTEENKTTIKNFNGTLYLFGNSNNYKVGDKILFVGDLTKYDLFNSRHISNFVNKNYYEINGEDIVVLNNSKMLSDSFKEKCFSLLRKNMSEENAEICYASLFGDKTKLDGDVRDSFSSIGIAHLLAVSGLHVGLIAVMLSFVFYYIKHKRILKIILFSIILFFYAYLCGFSPSVTRAVVMSIILFSADKLQSKYDSINSLSLAFIFSYLFLNPLSIFTIGMQLSFLCVFGIITLQKSTLKLLFTRKPYNGTKIAPPRAPKILESLAMSISVNFVILPIYITLFNQISIFTVFINLFFIPFFSLSFSIMFVSLLISLIFPFMDFILTFPNALFQIIKVVADFIAKIKIGNLTLFDCGFITLLAILILCFVIKCLVISKPKKRIISLFLFAIIIISFISYNIPNTYKNEIFVINDKDNMSVLIVDENNNVGLIGLTEDYEKINETLIDLKINNIDYVIAYNFNLRHEDILNNLLNKNNKMKIFIPEKYLGDNKQSLSDNFCLIDEFNHPQYICNYYYDINNDILGIDFNFNNKKYLVVSNNLNIDKTNQLFNQLSGNINYIIVKNCYSNFNDYYQYNIDTILYGQINKNFVVDDTFKQVLSTQFFTIKG